MPCHLCYPLPYRPVPTPAVTGPHPKTHSCVCSVYHYELRTYALGRVVRSNRMLLPA